ncbi:MAG: hypothetical protein DRH56_07985 [Deltaproteobacteria bacterium]|nr:MAG: hypothetical protein DRH56_07985 [Deltaproteobacteria bacterium]
MVTDEARRNMQFDDMVKKYDEWFESPLGAHVDRWEKRLTWRLARPRPGERVLDIGTGTANYLLELARMGLDCTGLDPGLKMMRRAMDKAAAGGLRLILVQAEGEGLPFPDGRFDLVLSVTAFEFFPDPQRAVAEMIRVCAPGGRIVVGVLNKWSIWAARRRILSWFRESIFADCRFYSYPEMRRFFGPVKWGTAAFAPPGLPAGLLPAFDLLEPRLQQAARPFGAYLAVRRDV